MTDERSKTRIVVRQPVSLFTSFKYYISAFANNWIVSLIFGFMRWKNRDFWASVAPSVIKTYPVRPDLPVRIFIPRENSQEKSTQAPLFFLIHGGGWVMGDAQMDDEQAHILADKYGFCVVSLPYRLAPRYQFPTAILDCLALMQAVLADENLPVDHDRVVVGGFSAGAVISLALAQLPDIKDRIKALVALFPLTDFTGEGRPKGQVSPWGREDGLPPLQGMFDWAYIPVGQDLREPLLSPLYATREDIPQPLFVITASADCLCDEGRRMACHLGLDEGSDMCDKESWESRGVKYHCVKDMPHSFTHFFEEINEREWEKKRQHANDEIWHDINAWLRKTLR
ncbi:Alpha/Beta hydrolase protein [Whalleya microplaca]|nr:Alpha/Beta hydrolase protein [Whalleya microplaca]